MTSWLYTSSKWVTLVAPCRDMQWVHNASDNTLCHLLGFFFYLLLDKFDQNLVTWLGLSIGLSIIWRWIEQLDLVRFDKCTHLLWYEWRTLIRSQSLRNTKSMNNMLSYKLNHLSMCHILQRNGFGPLSKIIRSNQHEAMPLWRWRINLSNKIQPPTSETAMV